MHVPEEWKELDFLNAVKFILVQYKHIWYLQTQLKCDKTTCIRIQITMHTYNKSKTKSWWQWCDLVFLREIVRKLSRTQSEIKSAYVTKERIALHFLNATEFVLVWYRYVKCDKSYMWTAKTRQECYNGSIANLFLYGKLLEDPPTL